MKKIEVFEATDGAKFDSEADAVEHEEQLRDAEIVREWVEADAGPNASKQTLTMRENLIVGYLAWARAQLRDEEP